MKVNVSSLLNNDGTQRFRHTFVNLYVSGECMGLSYVHTLGDGGVVFLTKNGQLTFAHTEVAKGHLEIEVVMPHTQWKQYGYTTICYRRKPARQWRRSLSEGTHETLIGTDYVRTESKEHTELPVRYPAIHASYLLEITKVIENQPMSFTQGVECLTNPKYHSVALTNGFLLGHEGSLYLETTKVAKFYFKQKSYKVHPLFAEELRDLTKGHIFKALEEEKYEYH